MSSASQEFLVPAFDIALNGTRLPPEVAVGVTTVVVTHELDSLDHFAFSVANDYPDLPFTHGKNKQLFREGSAVTITLGYVGRLEQVFDGEITRISPSYPAQEVPTITIEGHSRLHRLRGATHTRTFVNVTDSGIASQIAQEAGLQAKVEATSLRHPYVMQVNQTDLDFLLDRALRIGYELLADGNALVFRKPADGKPKSYTLVWGDPQRGFAPDQSTLPLYQFQPTLDATAPLTAITVRGQNPSTRDTIAGKGARGDEADQTGTSGAAVAQEAFARVREAFVVDMPVASQAEADQMAKALFNEHTLRLVTGSGSCIGIPSIRASSVVELSGLGPRFSGAYLVTQSTHRLDDDGYVTSFTVRRGAVG
jgi:phage protein D